MTRPSSTHFHPLLSFKHAKDVPAPIVAWRQAARRQAVHQCSAESQNPPFISRTQSVFPISIPTNFSHQETTIPALHTNFLLSICFIKAALYSPSCATPNHFTHDHPSTLTIPQFDNPI